MNVAFDLDGTLDTSPYVMQALVSALHAAGHKITVMTGASEATPSAAMVKQKWSALKQLGLADLINELVVIGDPPHAQKAALCKKLKVDLLVDNSVQNAKLCSEHCLVMLPWNTKVD